MTFGQLDNTVQQKLRMDINNNNATACMEDIFTNYHKLFMRNGLKWIVDENQKVAV